MKTQNISRMREKCVGALFCAVILVQNSSAQVTNVTDLMNAVNNGAVNSTVTIGSGTFLLTAPLRPKAGMTIKGAGIGQTVIAGAASWQPSTAKLPDYGVSTSQIETNAYLFSLTNSTHNITISDMTLTGPVLHGAIYGNDNDNLHLHHLKIDDFRWSGIRIFRNDNARIHDCEFVDAAGRWDNGNPGVTGGITGGCIYFTWMGTSEIWNNRFTKTQTGNENAVFGIKGRQAVSTRIHHNTINVNFAIELPFEGDHTVEIDHNVCQGVISIPKYAGGPVPSGGYTFHIHHNYFNTSYAIEFVRNGVEIDHNLFDFQTTSDGGNLISGHGNAAAQGPASFHNNLVKNPGRGVYWVNEVFNNIEFRNNHVIANKTTTPRSDGMFGFNSACNFSTITIKDNIIECIGMNRPLVRNSASNSANIQNNTLIGISDTANYANPNTGAVRGLTAPLLFTCGVNGEYTVDGWNFSQSTGGTSTSTGTGLRVTYFDNINFTGATVTRTEALDFNWGSGSPASGINSDTFSVRAEGDVQAMEAGSYEFRTQADDGIRLWIGGQLVIDNWVNQAPTYRTSPLITFAAGEKKTVKVEYYENSGGAVMRLQWKRPGQSVHSAVPLGQLYIPGGVVSNPGGTASASGEYLPNEGVAKAFDESASTKWLTFSPTGWIGYAFGGGTGYTITNYALTSGNDQPGRDPRSWQLLGSNDGISWTTVASESAQTFASRNQRRIFTVSSPGNYNRYRLNITQNNGGSYTQLAELELIAEFADWTSQDIGATGVNGSTTVAGYQFTARGAGADIWGGADAFHFVHRPLTGDGVFTARVDSVQNTNSWAKAGVMIRESLAANSKHAMMIVTPDGKASFQRRTTTGGSSTDTTVSGLSTPRWVRVVRSGNNFTAFHSANGTSWTQLGAAVSIPMGAQVYMGLAVTSKSTTTLCEAVFNNVE